MRTVMLIAVWLLICTSGFSADQDNKKQPQGETETAEEQAAEKEEPKQSQEKKQLQWPRPYQPREEISADSTVPFPTDI